MKTTVQSRPPAVNLLTTTGHRLMLWLAVAVAVGVQAAAPTTVSLDQLVAEALESNPELAFYEAELAVAKSGRLAAGKLANPDFLFELGYRQDKEIGGSEAFGDGLVWAVSVLQTFDFPGRMRLRKGIANRQIELAELGLAQFKEGLESRVRVLGWKLFCAEESTRAATEVRDRFQELLGVLVQREAGGPTPLLEARIIEASTVTLQRRATLAGKSLEATRLDLNQLLGRPAHAPLRVKPTRLEFPDLPMLDVLLAAARTNNYRLRMQALELEQQGFRVDLARKDRWNSVTLAPFVSNERGLAEETRVGVGVSIPLPLWNGNKGEIAAQQMRLQQAETSLQVIQRDLDRLLSGKALGYQRQVNEMRQWRRDSAQQFRDAAELGDRHYRLGSLPVSTYLELQKQYLDATDALTETRTEALENLLDIERLTGLSLMRDLSEPKTEANGG